VEHQFAKVLGDAKALGDGTMALTHTGQMPKLVEPDTGARTFEWKGELTPPDRSQPVNAKAFVEIPLNPSDRVRIRLDVYEPATDTGTGGPKPDTSDPDPLRALADALMRGDDEAVGRITRSDAYQTIVEHMYTEIENGPSVVPTQTRDQTHAEGSPKPLIDARRQLDNITTARKGLLDQRAAIESRGPDSADPAAHADQLSEIDQ
jgi:hypothetical protein